MMPRHVWFNLLILFTILAFLNKTLSYLENYVITFVWKGKHAPRLTRAKGYRPDFTNVIAFVIWNKTTHTYFILALSSNQLGSKYITYGTVMAPCTMHYIPQLFALFIIDRLEIIVIMS